MAAIRLAGGGRKSKPAGLRAIEGTKASCPAVPPDTLITPPKAYSLAPPPNIEGAALAMWNEEIENLENLGVLGNMDIRAFASLCEAYGEWCNSTEQVKASKKNAIKGSFGGMLIQTSNGEWKANPIYGIHNANKMALLRMFQEYGMTPVSRMRVGSLKANDGDKANKKKSYFTG